MIIIKILQIVDVFGMNDGYDMDILHIFLKVVEKTPKT